MRIVSVVLVVDTENAIASGSLQGNVYMVDNNKYFGSHREGTPELITAINDGQLIKWHVTPVVPENDVRIDSFFGQAIDEKIIIPQKEGFGTQRYWEAQVESRGTSATYQYSMWLAFGSHKMSFDPFLKVTG